ncbi:MULTISPECIES: 3-keto-5-aminohexanoate cleavage protein [unclassified Archaeoglobus]|jgi:3-keto-5-aminohexanoate cleavage enzyme|uniref:3-keto-5-aminohexanoate cleavage protein n=1 Tax=unclassified Archaeoglobus TaxID=2643606 RepID=UPI0025BF4D27|nr:MULTISPECIES: 3-keto-5-aminohexanoate cleavage protein [unclassified Archaeoglobus]
MEKLIITAALTGGEFVSKMLTPYVPSTVDEIVEEVVRCYRAGASIVHLHAKEPKTGLPHPDPNSVLPEYVKRIRESEASDIIINITTGGGRPLPKELAQAMGIEQKYTMEEYEKLLDQWMEERMKFGQEMSSLNMGSINIWEDLGIPMLRTQIFANPLSRIELWAKFMYENNVKPELEIYDTGMINTAKALVREGKLKEPLHIQFVMFGGLSCMSPTPETLLYCVHNIPESWTWSVCAPGKYEMRMAAMAIIMGGHVRVGMEDNIYVEKGVLAKSNAELVEKVVRIAKELGREIATPDEAREILGLKKSRG